METTTPLVNAIVNNALFHSNYTSVRRRIKLFTFCTCLLDSLPQIL